MGTSDYCDEFIIYKSYYGQTSNLKEFLFFALIYVTW